MTRNKLVKAIRQAQDFIEKSREALQELEKLCLEAYIGGTRKSGSCRRSSMELTNALSQLRKSN